MTAANGPALPPNYVRASTSDLRTDRTAAWLVQGAFVVITCAMLWLATVVGIPLTSDMGTAATIAATVGACLGYMAAHELTHAAVLGLLSRQRPSIALRFPYLTVGSSHYFTRYSIVAVALAPAVIWGTGLVLLLANVPIRWQFTVYVVIVLNVAGSAGDYLEAFRAARLPGKAVVRDDGTSTTVYLPATQRP